MKKWNWLFVNIYECDSLICNDTEILNWWQNGVMHQCAGGRGVVVGCAIIVLRLH